LNKIVPGVFIVIVFPLVGFFSGWLVGVSRASIVSSLVPLVVGLLGAITFAIFDRKSMLEKMLRGVQDLEKIGQLPEGTASKVTARLEGDTSTSWWLPAFWSVNVALFCGGCYLGIMQGIAFRAPHYQLPEAYTKGSAMEPEELGLTYSLYWYCKSNGVGKTDYDAMMTNAVRLLAPPRESDLPTYLRTAADYYEWKYMIGDSDKTPFEKTDAKTKTKIDEEFRTAKKKHIVEKRLGGLRAFVKSITDYKPPDPSAFVPLPVPGPPD
jgi:hypothetical protein